MSTILIGIAGGTGFGKTTLTRHLKEHFGPEVTVIGHDNYYKRQDGKTLEERAKVNYDHPAAFDTELLIEHLKELRKRAAPSVARSTLMWSTTARRRPGKSSPPRLSS